VKASFGTDGVRGVAGQAPITAEGGIAVGRAAARWASGAPVVVGWDTRPSSLALARAVAAGAAAGGASVLEAGVVPTSAIGVALACGLAGAGVMVTASHNAWPENGFKVFGPGGDKPDEDTARQIEAWMAEEPLQTVPGEVRDGRALVRDAWERAMSASLPPLTALAGRRIAVDLANGAGTAVADWLDRVPAEWVRVDRGGMPNDGVGSEHPEALQAAVRAHGCAAGIAVDGDADRCVLVDATGERVDGDALIWLLATELGVPGLAVTVMSNAALEAALPHVSIHRTPVGDRFLKQEMKRSGLRLGGEESGHLLFDDFPAGDGLLVGLRALAAAFGRADTLRAAVAPFRPFPKRLTKVRVAHRVALASVPAMVEAEAEARRTLGPLGRTLVRYSGTEPVLRLLVEGPDASAVAAASDALTAAAAAALS
jgi:phosphoglucosamine mutase